MEFYDINWLAVITATVSTFIVGFFWYSPMLFGNIWMKEMGLEPEKMEKRNMPLIFGTAFVLSFILALTLAYFLQGPADLSAGLKLGAIAGIGFSATITGIHYLYERKTIKLYLINVGYNLVMFLLMGAIIGAWQ